MMITKSWLRQRGACWLDEEIDAIGVSEMTAADLIRDFRVSWSDKQWVVCRLLIQQSPALLIQYAHHCRDSAQRHAARAAATSASITWAVYATTVASRRAQAAARAATYAAAAAVADVEQTDAAAGSATNAAAYAADAAAYAADAAAYAADAAAYADAHALAVDLRAVARAEAIAAEQRSNLEFAVSLLNRAV